jgi:uncharacterized protein with HEPN domain
MKKDADTDVDHLRLIIRMIADIDRRLQGLDFGGFAADIDELDLTAFRLGVIGETTKKLTSSIKDRHPELVWSAIYGMRNIIFHDYYAVDPKLVWSTAVNSLKALAAVCEQELKRLLPE